MHILAYSLHIPINQDYCVQVGTAVSDPYNILSSRYALVLEGDLLQGVDRLEKALPKEGAVHDLVGQHGRDIVQGKQQVLFVAREALHHLQESLPITIISAGELNCGGCASRYFRAE